MKNNIMILGVAGASGSGKTLVAENLLKDFGRQEVTIIKEDNYYKDLSGMPKRVRDEMNFDHPHALDHALLCAHLARLQSGENIEMPEYDYTTHCRKEKLSLVEPHKLIVLEGILLFSNPELRQMIDIKVFVDTPLDICLARRIQRDTVVRGRTVESVLSQYEKTVRPMYLQFIEPSKGYADIIVPHGGKNLIAIDIIKAKMNALLSN